MDKKEVDYLLHSGIIIGFVMGIVFSVCVYYLIDTVFGWV